MRFLAMFVLFALAVVLIPGPLFARETVVNAVGDIMLAGSGTATLKKRIMTILLRQQLQS